MEWRIRILRSRCFRFTSERISMLCRLFEIEWLAWITFVIRMSKQRDWKARSNSFRSQFRVLFGLHDIYWVYIYRLARWLLYKKAERRSCLFCLPGTLSWVNISAIFVCCDRLFVGNPSYAHFLLRNAHSFHSFVSKWQKFANKLLLNFFFFSGNCTRIVKQLQFHKWN